MGKQSCWSEDWTTWCVKSVGMSPTTPHLVCAKLILEIFMSFTYHVFVL